MLPTALESGLIQSSSRYLDRWDRIECKACALEAIARRECRARRMRDNLAREVDFQRRSGKSNPQIRLVARRPLFGVRLRGRAHVIAR